MRTILAVFQISNALSGVAAKRRRGVNGRTTFVVAKMIASAPGGNALNTCNRCAERTSGGWSNSTGSVCDRIKYGCKTLRTTITALQLTAILATVSTTTSTTTARTCCDARSITDTTKAFAPGRLTVKMVGS